jgi:hypothetical protein
MGQDYSVVHPALLLVGLLYLQYNHVKLARWKPGMKIRSNAVARIRIILYTRYKYRVVLVLLRGDQKDHCLHSLNAAYHT